MKQIDIITEFLKTEIIADNEKINLCYDDSLIESGIIDSLGIIKIIAFLKDKFAIKIDDEDILPEHFESVKAINAFVDKKRIQN